MSNVEPKYPIKVALPGGRVLHSAKASSDGVHVHTLCRKRGKPVAPKPNMSYCRACADRPNPIPNKGFHSA